MAGCDQALIRLITVLFSSLPQNNRYVVAVLFRHLATEFDAINLREKEKLTQKQKGCKGEGASGSYVEGY